MHVCVSILSNAQLKWVALSEATKSDLSLSSTPLGHSWTGLKNVPTSNNLSGI